MCKKDVFGEILALVTSETEVTEVDILNGVKTIEVVDARNLLVYFLAHHAGFSIPTIAKQLSLSPQGVAKILRGFDLRKKQSGNFFATTFRRVETALKTKSLLSE